MNKRQLRLSVAITGVILAPVSDAAGTPVQKSASQSAFNPANYSGGDGLSKAKAIVLKISSDSAGIASEYVWVAHTYPGAKVVQQALTTWDHGKRYDVLTLETADQSTIELWFDITLMYK